jgi:DNA polymerase elongation subunit (family B)
MNVNSLSNEQLLALKHQTENDISKYHNFQLVRKIQLNSAYGAIGNEYFRYYSTELAEAITLSGQLAIQWIGLKLNEFINKTVGTTNIDYVIASDTDSVYLDFHKIVENFIPNQNRDKTINYIDNTSTKIILPFIKKRFDELAEIMNAYENKMHMEREAIADKGIFTAKKRYMLNVWDSEGVRYTEPKLKIMGIETTRSSTPEFVRKHLKNAIHIIMNGNEQEMIAFVENCRNEFYQLSPEDIAFPRSVNGLADYSDKTMIYRKSTPMHVKGALIYNHYLDKYRLTKKYKKIIESDKIKYLHLKRPNPFLEIRGDSPVIAFPNVLPKEFGLEEFIDYKTQFEKSFIDPLTSILDIIGWSVEKKNTLESLFG